MDELSRFLMRLVGQFVKSRSWERSLAQHRIEPEDAAASVLELIVRNLPRLKLRSPCPSTLIAHCNRSVNNALISLVRRAKRKSDVHCGQYAEEQEYADTRRDCPEVAGLLEYLKSAERRICGERTHRIDCYRLMVVDIAQGRDMRDLEAMPKRIRGRIGADEFAALRFHLNRAIRRYQDDIAADGT